MTTDVTIMEEMLERATNPSRDTVDELGVQMFCMVAKSNVQAAQELLVAKVQSRNVREATRAISLLEECMSKCGSEFQDEISKFRFLNYLIRLVSKKYEGAETPQPIKQRIMECLLLWTTSYPQKAKIREAYDNLNKEGDVEHGNSMAAIVAATKRDSILGTDEELVRRLVNSNDPENYKRANLLIQYRVNQETRRTEFRLQQKHELQEVENTVVLLNQMLETCENDGRCDADGSETMNLIRELYMSCKKHKSILQRLVELNECGDSELTADTLTTNDMLLAVMKRYQKTVVYPSSKETSTPNPAQANTAFNDTTDLLNELLGDSLVATTTTNTNNAAKTVDSPLMGSANAAQSSKTLEELNEIFASLKETEETTNEVLTSTSVSIANILEPVAVFGEPKKTNGESASQQSEKRPFRELREIDELSAELFKQSLPACERVGSFKKDYSDKMTLNDLVKERVNVSLPPRTTQSTEPSPAKKAENVIKSNGKPKIEKVPMVKDKHEDDLMLDGEVSTVTGEKGSAEMSDLPLKHLSDIVIDLDDVVPKTEDRLLMDDDDVKITLNFTENRPSRHVSVIVLSVLNKSNMPVKNFQFEASVKKPNKVRLLPPTDTEMSPYKPFRPPMINQVMLLMNPTGKPVDVTCIVGYNLGADPDPIKESIVVKEIPFAE